MTESNRQVAAGRRLHALLLTAFVLVYLAVSIRHLSVVPAVYEDEPWQASTGLKLATRGVFGSDLFEGLNGMERRYYGFMPIHPLLLALTYRVAGFGLLQSRAEAVAMGLLILLLTYALGRRLFDSTVALVSVAFLLFVRTTGLTPSQVTGILLVDMARIARYDIVVPVFGLASLHVYLWSAQRRHCGWRFAVAGLLAGLAGLSHLHGAFWIVVLVLLALWNRAGWRSVAVLVAGCAAPWLVYIAYVLEDLPSWLAQTRGYAPRFGLTSLSWYWSNLLDEPRRYGPGLGPPGMYWLLRPGVWAALVVLPGSLAALGLRARSRHGALKEAGAARAILVPALALPALFALLLTLKLANYLITIVPIGAVAAAWGTVTLWRASEARGRVVLALLCLAVAAEGTSRYVALEQAAAQTTPYAEFISRVRAALPPQARVVGLHNYWFGLEQFDYRSFAVPLSWTDPAHQSRPLSLQQALDRVSPDFVLIDVRMREYFGNRAGSDESAAGRFRRWLHERNGLLVRRIDDRTYGSIEIYRLKHP